VKGNPEIGYELNCSNSAKNPEYTFRSSASVLEAKANFPDFQKKYWGFTGIWGEIKCPKDIKKTSLRFKFCCEILKI